MPTSVRLNDEIYRKISVAAEANSRSVPKQIEYWMRIAEISEAYPDLPNEYIKDWLQSVAEAKAGLTQPYQKTREGLFRK